MTEILHFPVRFQEPEDPAITEVAQTEVAELMRDIDRQAEFHGREQALSSLQEPFGDRWEFATVSEQKLFFRKLEGQTLVDLGCGRSDTFRKLMISQKIGAYIGVDLYLDGEPDGISAPPIGTVYPLAETTPSFLIKGDMLDVVSRLPDDSCSFALNGIDNMILEPNMPYTDELVRQIERASKAGGVIFGVSKYPGILNEFVQHPDYESSIRGLMYASDMTVVLHESRLADTTAIAL